MLGLSVKMFISQCENVHFSVYIFRYHDTLNILNISYLFRTVTVDELLPKLAVDDAVGALAPEDELVRLRIAHDDTHTFPLAREFQHVQQAVPEREREGERGAVRGREEKRQIGVLDGGESTSDNRQSRVTVTVIETETSEMEESRWSRWKKAVL